LWDGGAKEKGGPTFAARPIHQVVASLEAGDVRCLQALGALGHFELNGLAVVQGLITVRLNGGEVNENIFARLALNESESLAGIEPLNSSLFSQLNSLFFFKLFGACRCLQPQTKKAASIELAAPRRI
jgi:hypothetical protein